MASLTDLFNPTFLMFLGILLLAIALLVLYFESKFRDQNHKISSMLSLVSSLAEELNSNKLMVNHLTMILINVDFNIVVLPDAFGPVTIKFLFNLTVFLTGLLLIKGA